MNAFEKLTAVSQTLENKFLNDWQAQGKKVIGYSCTYLPDELLYAADILPYRITGRGISDTPQADSYMSRVNCSFARCVLEAALDSKYDFLDGVIFVNGCDHIRRCFENWEVHETAARPFMYMLPVPHQITERGYIWFKEEVIKMKEEVEKRFSVKITPDKLKEVISLYNETRRLLRKVYDLRASDSPPFTGAQALILTSASSLMPKPEFNRILTELLEEAEKKPAEKNNNTRLVVAGSLMDDPDFIDNVESLGAIVVSDSLCFGARSVWDLTEETDDPLDALCRRYYEHAPCPRMVGSYDRRLGFLKDQMQRTNADGVILEYIKFCDQHGTDNALLKNSLEKENIPVIELELQYGDHADSGRVRTRVQAFLERIG